MSSQVTNSDYFPIKLPVVSDTTRGKVDIKGTFTRTVSVPMSVTVEVYRCTNGDGPFDGQIGFGTHSVKVNLMVTVRVNGP